MPAHEDAKYVANDMRYCSACKRDMHGIEWRYHLHNPEAVTTGIDEWEPVHKQNEAAWRRAERREALVELGGFALRLFWFVLFVGGILAVAIFMANNQVG